jgi:hypothetical protein
MCLNTGPVSLKQRREGHIICKDSASATNMLKLDENDLIVRNINKLKRTRYDS